VFADTEVLARALRAVGHPARIEAVAAFRAGELSPIELTRVLGESGWTLGGLAYHVRTLATADLIELSATIPRRGAIEHRYALTPSGDVMAEVLAALRTRRSMLIQP
jgi:hypothetical protein